MSRSYPTRVRSWQRRGPLSVSSPAGAQLSNWLYYEGYRREGASPPSWPMLLLLINYTFHYTVGWKKGGGGGKLEVNSCSDCCETKNKRMNAPVLRATSQHMPVKHLPFIRARSYRKHSDRGSRLTGHPFFSWHMMKNRFLYLQGRARSHHASCQPPPSNPPPPHIHTLRTTERKSQAMHLMTIKAKK